ncbi:hypothetical protein Dimus_004704 [Dionaea muscipula]
MGRTDLHGHDMGCVSCKLMAIMVLATFLVGTLFLHFWANASVPHRYETGQESVWLLLSKHKARATKVVPGGLVQDLKSGIYSLNREANAAVLIERQLRTSSSSTLLVQSPSRNKPRSQYRYLPPVPVYYWLAKVVRDSKVKPLLNFEIGYWINYELKDKLPAASSLKERCSTEAAATKTRSRFHDQSHREKGRVTTSHQETSQTRTYDRTTITTSQSASRSNTTLVLALNSVETLLMSPKA